MAGIFVGDDAPLSEVESRRWMTLLIKRNLRRVLTAGERLEFAIYDSTVTEWVKGKMWAAAKQKRAK